MRCPSVLKVVPYTPKPRVSLNPFVKSEQLRARSKNNQDKTVVGRHSFPPSKPKNEPLHSKQLSETEEWDHMSADNESINLCPLNQSKKVVRFQTKSSQVLTTESETLSSTSSYRGDTKNTNKMKRTRAHINTAQWPQNINVEVGLTVNDPILLMDGHKKLDS